MLLRSLKHVSVLRALGACISLTVAPPAVAQLAPSRIPQPSTLPQLSGGMPENVQSKTNWRNGAEGLRQFQNPALVSPRGIDGLREAKGVPQVVADLLVLHARTLPAEELDSYIVNPKLAEEWLKAHPLPAAFVAKVRTAAADDGKKKKKGCSTRHVSSGCMRNEVEQSLDDLTREWREAWSNTTDELGRLLGRVDDIRACFTDRTLSLANIPVKFTVEPQIPLSFERDGKSSNQRGGASGTVKGTMVIGVPVDADFKAQVQMFYIPCLPFAVRPRSLGASGRMIVGGSFNATVNAVGQFNQSFTLPPTGGVQIPIAVLPIALGGIPIAVLDISVYLDGTLAVSGQGTLDGSLKMQSTQSSSFAFECSGHACELEQRDVPTPSTAIESVKLNGSIQLKPAIYSALQLSLNYNLLSVRAGPQPFLIGEVHGCAASAAQGATGGATAEQSHALTADLDGGLELRAEAVAGGQQVAKNGKFKVLRKHLYFRDLAQSTALTSGIAGPPQTQVGQSAAYAMKMPTCYPYPDAIRYLVKWTGGASGAPTTATAQRTGLGAASRLPMRTTSGSAAPSSCTLQSGQGTCSGAPLASTSINLAWPAAGDYSLTVVPVDDGHGRRFDASRVSQLIVRVQP